MLLVIPAAISFCGDRRDGRSEVVLRVAAAASLTDALTELAGRFGEEFVTELGGNVGSAFTTNAVTDLVDPLVEQIAIDFVDEIVAGSVDAFIDELIDRLTIELAQEMAIAGVESMEKPTAIISLQIYQL